ELERMDDRREVVGVGVHGVAVPGLLGASVAAPVVGDRPVSPRREERHLLVPIVGTERPAVAEHDRLSLAPVLDEDLGSVAHLHQRQDVLPAVREKDGAALRVPGPPGTAAAGRAYGAEVADAAEAAEAADAGTAAQAASAVTSRSMSR